MLAAPPPMTQLGADLYASLAPIAGPDAANGFPLAVICGAWGEMFRDVEELSRAQPGREPYQQAFDIETAPTWLYPWLGQLVGVRDLNGLTPDQQKAKIIAEAGFYRGSVPALQAAIASTLTGTQAVRVLQRTSDAWTLEAITNTEDTPDPALTDRVAQAAKVAMNLLTVIQSDVPIIDEGARTIDSGTATIDTAGFADIN